MLLIKEASWRVVHATRAACEDCWYDVDIIGAAGLRDRDVAKFMRQRCFRWN
jgi:hypothetical protein